MPVISQLVTPPEPWQLAPASQPARVWLFVFQLVPDQGRRGGKKKKNTYNFVFVGLLTENRGTRALSTPSDAGARLSLPIPRRKSSAIDLVWEMLAVGFGSGSASLAQSPPIFLEQQPGPRSILRQVVQCV